MLANYRENDLNNSYIALDFSKADMHIEDLKLNFWPLESSLAMQLYPPNIFKAVILCQKLIAVEQKTDSSFMVDSFSSSRAHSCFKFD